MLRCLASFWKQSGNAPGERKAMYLPFTELAYLSPSWPQRRWWLLESVIKVITTKLTSRPIQKITHLTMIWWYDDMMIWWYDDMMIWGYEDMRIWGYDDKMLWQEVISGVLALRPIVDCCALSSHQIETSFTNICSNPKCKSINTRIFSSLDSFEW